MPGVPTDTSDCRVVNPSRGAAFSMLEILVVLVIITLLVVVSVPGLQRMRLNDQVHVVNDDLGKIANAMANLEQEGHAIEPGIYDAKSLDRATAEHLPRVFFNTMMTDGRYLISREDVGQGYVLAVSFESRAANPWQMYSEIDARYDNRNSASGRLIFDSSRITRIVVDKR